MRSGWPQPGTWEDSFRCRLPGVAGVSPGSGVRYEAYRRTRKDDSVGVDEQTAEQYEKNWSRIWNHCWSARRRISRAPPVTVGAACETLSAGARTSRPQLLPAFLRGPAACETTSPTAAASVTIAYAQLPKLPAPFTARTQRWAACSFTSRNGS